MQIVVTSFGSDGDFNPLLAIAAALVRRGVTITFVANPFYEQRVQSTGSRFVGAGKSFDVFAALHANPRYLNSGKGAVAIWKELVAPSIGEIYPVVRETVRRVGATAVVSHVLSYGGVWAAVNAGVRNVVVTTSASAWLSRHHPMVVANWRAPRMVQAALTVALRGLGDLTLRHALRRLALAVGAGVRDVVPIPDLNLGVWPEWFRTPAPDDPPRARLCGFVFDPVGASQPIPTDVARFLAAGAAPVVAGFGSAASLHAADRYRVVADACEILGRRCVLVGRSAQAVAPTANVMVVPSAPYARIFPAASVIVHHGGFGTCAEALRAGKPSLVTPFAFDQFDSAARVHDAGLGRWLVGKAHDAGALARALDSVLRSESSRAAARDAAEKIATAPDGADRAAELIAALS
ncbi:MAG TPA: glycosyltransferase [Candidatus Binatia bacterium]|nr:glycosyltransferase [Candidatus Binatia bacterium]